MSSGSSGVMPPTPWKNTSGSPDPPSRYFTGACRVSIVLAFRDMGLLGRDGGAGRRARGVRGGGRQGPGRRASRDRVAPEPLVGGVVGEDVAQLGHHLLGEQLGGVHALLRRH